MIAVKTGSIMEEYTFKEGFIMGVTRKLLNWCDTTFNEALHEEDGKKAYNKSFASGAVEGFMDAAIMMYVPVVIACYIWKMKATKK